MRDQKTSSIVLSIICEELKNRRFFNHLRAIGLHDCWYEFDLSTAVFELLGITAIPDDLLVSYHTLIEIHSHQLIPETPSLNAEARAVYNKLHFQVSGVVG